MIFYLIELLKWIGIKVPGVFHYFSTRMLLAAITSLVLTVLIGPRFIKKLYELKIGDKVRLEDCPLLKQLHEKKKDTPTMGGLLILLSMLISMALWMNWHHAFTLVLLFVTLSIGLIGFWDDYRKLKYDYKGLSGRKKLFFQLLVSGFISLYLLCPPVTQAVQVGEWFSPPVAKELSSYKKEETLTTQQFAGKLFVPYLKHPLFVASGAGLVAMGLFFMFVITGASNAVNLTDGLDGLAPGCLVLAASSLALVGFVSNNVDLARYLHIPYIEGSGEIAIYLSALCGACLGFMWFNGYPAQVFMGDTGSLSLGAILGVSAVLLRKELFLSIVGGIFVAEALSVILQVASYKYRNKRRIFRCAPLHHHFEYLGWAETKVVLRFWIVGLLLAIIGISTLKFQ